MNSQAQPVQMASSDQFHDGLYPGFTGNVYRRPAEQLVFYVNDGCRQGFKEIHLLISSAGGSMEHGFYAALILRELPVKLLTHKVRDVSSAGALVLKECAA